MSIKFFVPKAKEINRKGGWNYDVPILIGVSGFKGHGKDTLFKQARRHIWNPRPEAKMFAAPIKAMTMAFLLAHGIPYAKARKYVYGSIQDKETPIPECGGKTSRQIQQTLGTEWGRDTMGRDVWANALMARWDNNIDPTYPPRWVITDVRFHNEVDAIYARGGHVIRVNNPRLPTSNDPHPSEAEIPFLRVSAEITNDGRKINLARDMMAFYAHVYGIVDPSCSDKVKT